jgi:hypothetical protein
MQTTTPRWGNVDQFDCVPPQEVKREFTSRLPRPNPQTKRSNLTVPALILGGCIIVAAALQNRPTATSRELAPTVYREVVAPTPTLEVPRALLVNLPAAKAEPVYERPDHWMDLPDGTNAFIHLQGDLGNPNQLPMTGNHIGDAFHVGTTTYAWLVPQGHTAPTWIDP